MIDDGYNRKARIRTDKTRPFSVIYRPATRRERTLVRRTMQLMDDADANAYALEWMQRHIVLMSPKLDLVAMDEADPYATESLFMVILGEHWDGEGGIWADTEEEWKQNLKDGIRLLLTNPGIAHRSCELCTKYWFSEKTGKILLDNATGKPMLRKGVTMCRTEQGCPKGSPEKQKSLNNANKLAVQHYLECRATGIFPDDAIVKMNAALIERELRRKK